MTSYQYQQQMPARQGGTDLAAWALVALVVVLACAGAGWALARSASPGGMDLARTSELATRDGLVRGEAAGLAQGARQGRREASLRARGAVAAERRQAAREGYEAGYAEGRAKAGAPDAFAGTGSLRGGAYPAAGYEDVLAADLFGADAPGYSDSAFGSLGYGDPAFAPYVGGTSLGDSY